MPNHLKYGKRYMINSAMAQLGMLREALRGCSGRKEEGKQGQVGQRERPEYTVVFVVPEKWQGTEDVEIKLQSIFLSSDQKGATFT